MLSGLPLRCLTLCAAAVPWLATPRLAAANESDEPVVIAEIAELDQATLDQAETLFFQALGHYRQGRYGEAAVDFQKAFVLTNHRDLLFNIARSREKLGDQPGAIDWYRAYLATKPADETAVIHRIRELGGDPTPAPADLEDIADEVGIETPLVQQRTDPWPWVAFGVGLAAAGAGTYFGLDALTEASAARAAETRAEGVEHKDAAEQSALVADISFAVGAVAVGTAIFLWTRADAAVEDARVEVGVAPGGGYLGYSLDF